MTSLGEIQRMRDIVRSKEPMDELCKNKLITPEACDWIKSALDPFHDMQLEHLRGYPDVATEPTVVVKIRQAVTVAKPPGLAAGANWDCHIALSPIDFSPCDESAVTVGKVHPFGDKTRPTVDGVAGYIDGFPNKRCARMDGLLINSVPATGADGANMTFTPEHCPPGGTGGYELQQINLDDYLDYEDTDLGVYRLVYSGFEVVNTTAQIYKQGAVTVYEYGNSFEMGASMPAYGPAGKWDSPISQPTTYFRCPPNTLAEAKIMPGSHSWAAQDGCYNTAKFQSENKFQGVTRRPWAICQNNPTAPSASGYLFDPTIPGGSGSFVSDRSLIFQNTSTSGATTPGGSPATYGGPMHYSMMNTTGAYFTGLSEQTTLFVTWRVGIERLPAANKPAFLALAQPSATFDPNALVLYNMVANILPPGCPQGYNDMGKWFRWVSAAAQKSIPTVYPIVRTASMLANTMGRPIIAAGLNGLAEGLKPMAEKQAANRLQQAVRNKQRQNNKPAVQNWAKPSQGGRSTGGTNGLR